MLNLNNNASSIWPIEHNHYKHKRDGATSITNADIRITRDEKDNRKSNWSISSMYRDDTAYRIRNARSTVRTGFVHGRLTHLILHR